MVRFPTGHHWHCNWSVQKASPGMCLCKLWRFEHLLWTNSYKQFAFSCVFGSSGFYPSCQILLCWCLKVDRPTLLNSERKKVNFVGAQHSDPYRKIGYDWWMPLFNSTCWVMALVIPGVSILEGMKSSRLSSQRTKCCNVSAKFF